MNVNEHFITVAALEQNVSESCRSPRWEQQEFDKAGSAALTRSGVLTRAHVCSQADTRVCITLAGAGEAAQG